MAYDEKLLHRVRALLRKRPGFEEKKMFGGVCLLLHGKMACGIIHDDLIVRVGPDKYEEALGQPHTRKFDMTGRAMKGWVMVSAKGHRSDKELAAWVNRGVSFAKTLPKK